MRVKQIISLLCLCAMVLLTGCQGGTRVIKDGFTARQVTEEDMRFLRSTRSWDTKCRWDQLMQERSSGNWYCPPEEDFKTVAYATHVDPSKSDAVISAAIHGLFFFGGMGLFGALAPETRVTQTGSTINETFSTKYIGR